MQPTDSDMSEPERKIRSAEANYTRSALDEIMGNVDDKTSAKARTAAANDEVDKAWGRDTAAPGPTKPGLFSRIGKAFSKFGQRVSAFFGGKQSAGLDSGATLDRDAMAGVRDASTNDRDQSESKTPDESLENRYNVTYTRGQARAAAARMGAQSGPLEASEAGLDDMKSGDRFDISTGRTGADSTLPTNDVNGADDVKRSLNVTMTRSEALEAAKKLTHAAADEKSHDIGKPSLGR